MTARYMIAALGAAALFAQSPIDHPTGPRMTPPTLNSVAPLGISRGTATELTIEGLNLASASAIYFSEPGIKGRIVRVKELPDLPDIRLGSNGTPSTVDVGPLPPRNQVTVELDVAPETAVGPVKFRLLTPLGTSPEGTFLVEPYFGEAPDREPNDNLDSAFETYLPAVLAGSIARAGDVDHFKIAVKAGEEIVFENQAAMIGSTLQPVVRILAPDQSVIREFGYDGGETASRFTHRFDKAGAYYVRIADYESSGRASNFYRILAGKLPVTTSVYPLGLRRDAEREVVIGGSNLGAAKISVKGAPSPEDDRVAFVRPKTPSGESFSQIKLALGDDPEIEASGANLSTAAAQNVTAPVTVNGRIGDAKSGAPVTHYYKFVAKKGQAVTIEVEARRFGSELDSIVEVLDARGKPVERAVARATWETSVVLRDHDSVSRGIRVQSWNVLNIGDYMMVGNEIVRVEEVPDGPDEDLLVENFGGQRLGMFGTTPEAHGVDRSIYKVQMHPAGAQFSPNGLPLARFYYRNDDGGPGYGKDSLVDFVAPADGDYYAAVRDVRGLGGDRFAYRLHIREPRPSFDLAVSPRNPNVPRGGTIPVTVTALRREGYQGPIEVVLSDLPKGLTATRNQIAAGQTSCTLLISAAADASFDNAVPFEAIGRATIGGRTVTRKADAADHTKLIAVTPAADVLLHTLTRVVELAPGETKEVSVKITRQNGFAGRVPVEVRDLPARVRVSDSGLNGVLITEDEAGRSFRLLALPNAEPVEGYVYLSGRVETRSGQQNSYASLEPVLVRVKSGPKPSTASPTPALTGAPK